MAHRSLERRSARRIKIGTVDPDEFGQRQTHAAIALGRAAGRLRRLRAFDQSDGDDIADPRRTVAVIERGIALAGLVDGPPDRIAVDVAARSREGATIDDGNLRRLCRGPWKPFKISWDG